MDCGSDQFHCEVPLYGIKVPYSSSPCLCHGVQKTSMTLICYRIIQFQLGGVLSVPSLPLAGSVVHVHRRAWAVLSANRSCASLVPLPA